MAKKNENDQLEQENKKLLELARKQAARIKQLEEERDQLFVNNVMLKTELEFLQKVVGG